MDICVFMNVIPLLSLALVLQQTPAESSIADLVGLLGDDHIEIRSAAETELLGKGAEARPFLVAEAANTDPEIRLRIQRILAIIRLKPVVRDLVTKEWEKQEVALGSLFKESMIAAGLLSRMEDDLDGLSSFRTRQLIALLRGSPVKGLRFGMLYDSTSYPLWGPVPAWEVFFNSSSDDIILEILEHACISGYGRPTRIGGGMSGGGRRGSVRSLRTKTVTLVPGAVHLKRRNNIMYSRSRNGGYSTWEPLEAGSLTLIPTYTTSDESAGRWTGKVVGNAVKIEFTRVDK